jgi:hypothetical protein
MKRTFKTIFIALVCIVSLIALGPLASWGDDETLNPIWVPPFEPLPNIWVPPFVPMSDQWVPPFEPLPNMWAPSFEPMPNMWVPPFREPPTNAIFDNLFSNSN